MQPVTDRDSLRSMLEQILGSNTFDLPNHESQEVIEREQVRKYLLYANGEIMLVVLGILITHIEGELKP